MAHRRHRTPLPASRRRLVGALERWTLFQLDRAAAALREVTEEALEPHGLSVAAFAALCVIATRGPTSQAAIAERIGVDRMTMSRLAADLEEEGIVERRADLLDRRRRPVRLTDVGAGTYEVAATAVARAEARFLEGLHDYERDDLRRTLRRLEPPEYALGDLYFFRPVRIDEEADPP